MTHENHDEVSGAGDTEERHCAGRLQAVKCYAYAYVESNGTIDLDSIAETEDAARRKMLEESMGWRFDHPERYSQDDVWQRLLASGKVVPVSVSEVSGRPDNVPVYTLIPFESRAGLSAPVTYWQAPPVVTKKNCNGCGTGGWKGALVPDTIWGVSVTSACDIHDWMYAEGTTADDKDRADLTFLANMLSLIDDAAATARNEDRLFAFLAHSVLAPLRRWRAWHYYEAVRYAGNGPFYRSKLVTENKG